LCDILTVSTPPPGPDPAFVAEMLDRNRRLFEEAQLKENIALARSFTPLSAPDQAALAERVKPFATDGRFEQFNRFIPTRCRWTPTTTC
jgi:hypothetical protein